MVVDVGNLLLLVAKGSWGDGFFDDLVNIFLSLSLYKLCYGLKPGEIKLPVSILGLVAFVALGFEEWILLPGLSAAISDNL